LRRYAAWLGLAFERYCRDNADQIAEILRFSGIDYHAGAYFNRRSMREKKGVQIDLLFERADKVLTICEIKYQDRPVGIEVIHQFEERIQCLELSERQSIQRVLISASGVTMELTERSYFDKVLTLEDLML
jgi:hypothetical protein